MAAHLRVGQSRDLWNINRQRNSKTDLQRKETFKERATLLHEAIIKALQLTVSIANSSSKPTRSANITARQEKENHRWTRVIHDGQDGDWRWRCLKMKWSTTCWLNLKCPVFKLHRATVCFHRKLLYYEPLGDRICVPHLSQMGWTTPPTCVLLHRDLYTLSKVRCKSKWNYYKKRLVLS